MARVAIILAMFVLVTILWIPFATNDIEITLLHISRMINFGDGVQISNLPIANLHDFIMMAVGLAIIFLAPTSHQFVLGYRKTVWPLVAAALLIAICAPLVVSRSANEIPFLYFNF